MCFRSGWSYEYVSSVRSGSRRTSVAHRDPSSDIHKPPRTWHCTFPRSRRRPVWRPAWSRLARSHVTPLSLVAARSWEGCSIRWPSCGPSSVVPESRGTPFATRPRIPAPHHPRRSSDRLRVRAASGRPATRANFVRSLDNQSTTAISSFLPSGVAPISTNMH